MKCAPVCLGMALLLGGCGYSLQPTPNSSHNAEAQRRFIPVAGDDPYIMFDEQSAQACWSGPIDQATSGSSKYPAWFHPFDPAESNTGQPTGKFADDGKGIPTCRQLMNHEKTAVKKYAPGFHPD